MKKILYIIGILIASLLFTRYIYPNLSDFLQWASLFVFMIIVLCLIFWLWIKLFSRDKPTATDEDEFDPSQIF